MNYNLHEPAFPIPDQPFQNGVTRYSSKGVTLKIYAALTLRVPRSGIPELDDMIREARHLDAAERALGGAIADVETHAYNIEACAEMAMHAAHELGQQVSLRKPKPEEAQPSDPPVWTPFFFVSHYYNDWVRGPDDWQKLRAVYPEKSDEAIRAAREVTQTGMRTEVDRQKVPMFGFPLNGDGKEILNDFLVASGTDELIPQREK